MEFPHLDQMYRELASQQFGMIALTGYGIQRDTLRALRDAHHIAIPMAVVANADDPSSVYGRYKAQWKTFMILDPAGKIVYAGPYDRPKFRAALAKLGIKWPDSL